MMRKIKISCPKGYCIDIDVLANYIVSYFEMLVTYNFDNNTLSLNGVKYDQAVAWIKSLGIAVEEIAQ